MRRIVKRFRQWLRFSRLSSFIYAMRECKTYSQFGEDAVLRGFLLQEWRDPSYRGFWVDIGAHHPVRLSNTKMFSDHGWRGLNVDAMAESIRLFEKQRRRDINVNVGVGGQDGLLDFCLEEDSGCNSFIQDAPGGSGRAKTRQVKVVTLKRLLDTYLPDGQEIDFLDVDVEGMDLEVLKSNDWRKYRPKFILVEIFTNGKNADIGSSPVVQYLQSQGYEFAGQCYYTTLFRRMVDRGGL